MKNAEGLVGIWVLHRPTLVVGRVKLVHERGKYTSPGEHKPIDHEVVELESGHAFIRVDDAFEKLSQKEAELYEHGEKAIGWVLRELVVYAHSNSVTQPQTVKLLQAIVAAQLRHLQVEHGEPQGS